MKKFLLLSGRRACMLAAVATLGALPAAKAGETAWTNLVSDIPGVARYPDANLVNPIGAVALPGGTVIAADNGTGLLSVYNATGILGVSKFATPESIAIPAASGTSEPTGVVFNDKAYTLKGGATSFVISGAASQALVATEEGTVVGVSLSDSTATVAYTGAGAVYKGLALSGTGGGDGQQLYLANFKNGTVDVLNESFQPVILSPTTANTFSSNPATQAGCMPFNAKAFSLKNGTATFHYIFVTYAKPDPSSTGLDLRGAAAEGDGYVLAFDPSGNFRGVIATSGTTLAVPGAGARTVSTGTAASVVSSPWGMAMLHSLDRDGGTLFVGNVADGTIQTFTLTADAEGAITSMPGGPLVDVEGNTFQIENLWGLHFGPAEAWAAYLFDSNQFLEDAGSLFFTAGIAGETHGLLGKITSRELVTLPAHFRFNPVKFK